MTEEQFLEMLQNPTASVVLGLFVLWTMLWKGLALYRAGSNRSPGWFVVLLVVNTLGILEILYVAFFSQRRRREMDARLTQA